MSTKTNNKNLTATLTELHKAFNYLNNEFYKGELPEVVITVQTRGKRNAYGWFTVGKVWEDGSEGKHEINITPEFLDREPIEIMRTLHHEMIHLYCHVNDIQDTSRGGNYHNTRFKKVSEEHGFYYEDDAFDKKCGWTFSKLTPESMERIMAFDVNYKVFNELKRHDFNAPSEEKPKKKSNIIKWVCGCGNIVRTSKDGLRMLCLDCETMYMKEDEIEGLEGAEGNEEA